VEQRIHSVAYLGEAHLWAGELVGALSCGQEALELSRTHLQRRIEARVLRSPGPGARIRIQPCEDC
jgi:hypothetical protein